MLHCFYLIQLFIKEQKILAGHDKSDGGLLTTLLEMAFTSNLGMEIMIPKKYHSVITEFLFNEELGVVIEIDSNYEKEVLEKFLEQNITIYPIARVLQSNKIIIQKSVHDSSTAAAVQIYKKSMTYLRSIWESTSHKLELLQCNTKCAEEEYHILGKFEEYRYHVLEHHLQFPIERGKYSVAILREEGTNSDKELAAAFYHAGFNVVDLNTHDLVTKKIDVNKFNGLAFAGGFSFSDNLGAGKGWSLVLEKFKDDFDRFYKRPNTFSIGICNGCQLMAHLGWILGSLQPNVSNRFESRFSTVKVNKSNNILLKNMEDLVFGIWTAHASGRFVLKPGAPKIPDIQYVNPVSHQSTMAYPHNPNGSDHGTVALSSPNNRHLGIMPHPERSFLKWQIPWCPVQLPKKSMYTPWFKMFVNARRWLETIYNH